MSIITRLRLNKDLKKDYKTTLLIGYVISLSLVVLAATVKFEIDEVPSYTMADQEVISIEEIVQTTQLEKPPVPPTPPVPVEVPDETILDDVDLDLDASLDILDTIELPPPPLLVEDVVEEDEEEIFVIVESMPEIIGGMDALYKEVKYPEIARKAGIEGLVVLQVVINVDGTPSNIEVVKSASAILDEAAITALNKVRFIPGRQRGKNVMVRMNIPIRFRLIN